MRHHVDTSLVTIFLILLSSAAMISGCKKVSPPEPEGYRVVSYDFNTGQWVVIRTAIFDGKRIRKRLTMVCDFYKWGDRDPATGPHACELHVGELMVPHHQPDAQGTYQNFVDVWEMSADRLSVVHGDGPDKVSQQFVILRNEVVPDPSP